MVTPKPSVARGGDGGVATPLVKQRGWGINEGLRSHDMRASFARLGIDARIQSPEEYAAVMAEQAREWAEIVKLTGIKIE